MKNLTSSWYTYAFTVVLAVMLVLDILQGDYLSSLWIVLATALIVYAVYMERLRANKPTDIDPVTLKNVDKVINIIGSPIYVVVVSVFGIATIFRTVQRHDLVGAGTCVCGIALAILAYFSIQAERRKES